MNRIEQKILANLIHNEQYCRKVAPFIDPSYFQDKTEKVIVQEILNFFGKYNKPATQDVISIEVRNRKDVTDKELAECDQSIQALVSDDTNIDWLVENTEKFCKDRAVYNAILGSIKIIDGKDTKLTQDAIPKILADALAVSFDQHIGHDYIDNSDDRYEFYHRVEDKIQFDIDLLNKITSGGLSKKSLNIVLAGCVHPDTKIRVRIRKRASV